jgi:hypothetical protein
MILRRIRDFSVIVNFSGNSIPWKTDCGEHIVIYPPQSDESEQQISASLTGWKIEKPKNHHRKTDFFTLCTRPRDTTESHDSAKIISHFETKERFLVSSHGFSAVSRASI